jgi:hypothetical protein
LGRWDPVEIKGGAAQKYEVGANYALGPGNLVVGDAWSLMLGMDLRF